MSTEEYQKLCRDFPNIDPDLFRDLYWVSPDREHEVAVTDIRRILRKIRFVRHRAQEVFRARFDMLKQKFKSRYGQSSWNRIPYSTAESSLFDNSLKTAVMALRMQYFATQPNIELFYEEITWIEEQTRVITEKEKAMSSVKFIAGCETCSYCCEKHGVQKCWILDHGSNLEEGDEVLTLP